MTAHEQEVVWRGAQLSGIRPEGVVDDHQADDAVTLAGSRGDPRVARAGLTTQARGPR